MNPLLIVCIFTGLIHFTETLSSAMRLAGVRTKQVATSMSFVNSTLLVSRMSNMIQAPLLGAMVDSSIIMHDTNMLVSAFRVVIFAGFLGALVGAILIPYAVRIFERAITRFERTGSVPRMIFSLFNPVNAWRFLRLFRLPERGSFMNLSLKGVPKTFLVLNMFMVSIYAIGVLAALYAGAMVPEYRVTATMLSAIINGIATVLFTLMVDPVAARITDQAARGKRPEADVRAVVFYLVLGRLFGVLIISQLIFLPAASYVKTVTLLISGVFGQ